MMFYRSTGERDTSNEMRIRNKFVQFVFQNYSPCIAVLIDGDELISRDLLPHILAMSNDDRYDSIAFGCLHLYDDSRYLHLFPAPWNGIAMIDPHVRVMKSAFAYEPGEYFDSADCFIRPSPRTPGLRQQFIFI